MDITTRLGSILSDRYRVEREIGAGGMATVYLAEDVKHRRRVALKVLRPELGAVLGPERFLAEINVTANLQHPHLLPLFDSGEADGLLFYVMPFVEGESLRRRLERERQLPVDEAVRIATAVLSALDHAHRHGVVHRDLKPENILLHEGEPLISDFGIALAISNAGGARVTQTGLSLGTPQYMSPEQATSDRIIDARSDIYSLAAVLYEMLTGDPPHTASTTQAVIAKVLTEKPVSVRTYRPTVPQHVDEAITQALSKLPADRFPSAQRFAEALSNPRAVLAHGPGRANRAAPAWRRQLLTAAPWGIAVVGLTLAATSMARAPQIEPAPTARFEIQLPAGVELVAHTGLGIAVSPDGRTVVFTATSHGTEMLFARSLDDVQPRPIPGTENARSPFFSPDGRSLGFYTLSGERLWRIALAGGTPSQIGPATTPLASWGPDDAIVVGGQPGEGLLRYSVHGGEGVPLTRLDSSERRHVAPHFLPGRRALLLRVTDHNTASHIAVATMDGKVRRLGIEGFQPRYARGHLFYNTADGSIRAVPFDVRRLRVTGPPVAVQPNVRLISSGGGGIWGGTGVWAVSPNGTLAYDAGASTGQLVAVDRTGQSELLSTESRQFRMPRVSPDGARIAIEVASGAQGTDLWILDRRGSTLSRFTALGGVSDALWSPDGRTIAYAQRAMGSSGSAILRQNRDGTGTVDTLRTGAGGFWPWSYTPDGRTLLFDDLSSGPMRILAIELGADTTTRTVVADPRATVRLGRLSPDGAWLAHTSTETGRTEVYVRPFPGPGGRVQISTAGGDQPMWSRDGTELFYRDGRDFIAVAIRSTPEFAILSRTPLFADRFLMSNATNYDVLPDGRFLMLQPVPGTERLFVIANWQPPAGETAAR